MLVTMVLLTEIGGSWEILWIHTDPKSFLRLQLSQRKNPGFLRWRFLGSGWWLWVGGGIGVRDLILLPLPPTIASAVPPLAPTAPIADVAVAVAEPWEGTTSPFRSVDDLLSERQGFLPETDRERVWHGHRE